MKDYGKAEEIFLEIQKSDPQNVEALNNLGIIAFIREDNDNSIEYFTSALEIDPYYKDAIINLSALFKKLNLPHEAAPYLEKAHERYPFDERLKEIFEKANVSPTKSAMKTEKKEFRWKLYYSPGIKRHGENARNLLALDHYIPSLHYNESVWFFGLFFDLDYLILQAHQGKKIINWRGADSWRMLHKRERINIIKSIDALHVCQAQHQRDLLMQLGIQSIVRPMMNSPFHDIGLRELPKGKTCILVYWRSGDDNYIQAELFFNIAAHCSDIEFHVVGDEDPSRFNKPGMENVVFHGYIGEKELDQLMDKCKGTIRPWIWDGNPNIQTKMLLKGRYAAHSCLFEKVAHCTPLENYVL